MGKGFHPLTYGHKIEEYIRHPEAKSRVRMARPARQKLTDFSKERISQLE